MSDYIIGYRPGLVIFTSIDEAVSQCKLLMHTEGPWRAKSTLSVWELLERRSFVPGTLTPPPFHQPPKRYA